MSKMRLLIFYIVLFFSTPIFAQTDWELELYKTRESLDSLALVEPLFNSPIDVSVTNFSLADLIRSLSVANGLNINIAFSRNKNITCNLRKVSLKDALFFFCKEKSLELEIIGSIITIRDYVLQVKLPEPEIEYEKESGKVSMNLSGVPISEVSKRFGELTGVNIIYPASLSDKLVSAHMVEMAIEEAVMTIAGVNSMKAQKGGENTWLIFEEKGDDQFQLFSSNEITIDSLGRITANILSKNVSEILAEVFGKMKVNWFLASLRDYKAGIKVSRVSLDVFLETLFTGTNITWRNDRGIYIIGESRADMSLSSVRIFSMKYRTVDTVSEIIPKELSNGLEIKTFPDLNSLVLCGDLKLVNRLVEFLQEIDISVPLISIDVIIVDATDRTIQSLGLSMGVGKARASTSGNISPGVDLSLDPGSVNKIINSFNGFGAINLGKVSQNFYADLKLLEEDGKIILRSTPRLSTLNGHKATLKSGQVKYYKESQVNIIGTQNPLQSESYLWKNVEASFILDMTPYVSQDSTITLNIDLNQDEFTERETNDMTAPPGMTKRSFNSIIKVKNEEMVLLGGIEKNYSKKSSKGLPFLARIPIIRLLFGNVTKEKENQKLNVFIRPTIIE